MSQYQGALRGESVDDQSQFVIKQYGVLALIGAIIAFAVVGLMGWVLFVLFEGASDDIALPLHVMTAILGLMGLYYSYGFILARKFRRVPLRFDEDQLHCFKGSSIHWVFNGNRPMVFDLRQTDVRYKDHGMWQELMLKAPGQKVKFHSWTGYEKGSFKELIHTLEVLTGRKIDSEVGVVPME